MAAGIDHIDKKLRSPALLLWPYAGTQEKDQQQLTYGIWEDKIRSALLPCVFIAVDIIK